MSTPDVYKEVERRMTNSLDSLKKDLNTIRTGRASSALFDSVKVDYYGTPTPLTQAASITIPENNLILIQPWDKSLLPSIEKAIMSSGLGLTPGNDGNVIRIPIPSLTEERRKELVKIAKKSIEDARISIRTMRKEGIDALKKMEKEIPEDIFHKASDEVQKITDRFIKKIEAIFTQKEDEILHN